jgi:hypothetical protein
MTLPELLAQYEARIRELQIGVEHARLHGNLAAAALTLALLLSAFLFYEANHRQNSFRWPWAPIPAAILAARTMYSFRRSGSRLIRLRRFYNRALRRLQGDWAGNGMAGDEFDDPDHLYARDLNIFGEGSLFELLCTTRTAIGRRGLAQYLVKANGVREACLRQEAIRELAGDVRLREKLAVLGQFDFSEAKWETFTEWLDSPPFVGNTALRIASLTTSVAIAAIALSAITALLPWYNVLLMLAPLLAFHAVIGRIYQKRVTRMLSWLHPLTLEVRVLREGLELMQAHPFEGAKLRALAASVRGSTDVVRRLERLLNALLERNKEMFYHVSLALLFATQVCWAVDSWRVRHGAGLGLWLEAWAEFEALVALGTYAHENSANTYPEFSSDPEIAKFEAEDLAHPLIPPGACVSNDICFNPQSRFYVISGSNMSGKSTLLRAIGLNAVLAYAGAPVRAQVLRLSELAVGASISIVDSLQSGKSKFMAEVDRLRQILEMASDKPGVLFLIDEIFAGTNSRDRRLAAEAIVRTLINRGAIGAISTHHLAISEIPNVPGLLGVNVHTGSRDGSDPMDFDYRLKPGITTETNALAIARMAGVPV